MNRIDRPNDHELPSNFDMIVSYRSDDDVEVVVRFESVENILVAGRYALRPLFSYQLFAFSFLFFVEVFLFYVYIYSDFFLRKNLF